jgi:hypothetical protein
VEAVGVATGAGLIDQFGVLGVALAAVLAMALFVRSIVTHVLERGVALQTQLVTLNESYIDAIKTQAAVNAQVAERMSVIASGVEDLLRRDDDRCRRGGQAMDDAAGRRG